MKLEIKNLNKVLQEAIQQPSPKQMFGEFWYQNELCILFACENVGKSILAIQAGEDVARTGNKVLYLDFELSAQQIKQRYSNKNVDFHCFNENLLYYNGEVMNEEELFDFLLSSIAQYQVNTIIIDNISYMANGLESGTNALTLMKRLNEMKKDFNISMLLIAHTKKRNNKNIITSDDLSGSKKIVNFCDSAFCIGRSNINQNEIYLKQIKVRNGEYKYTTDNVLVGRILKVNSFLKFVPSREDIEEDLLKPDKSGAKLDKVILKQRCLMLHYKGISNREIAKRLGITEGTVRNWLKLYEVEEGGNTRKALNCSKIEDIECEIIA